MADPLEKEIEKAWSDYARSKGVLCRKWTCPGHSGVPDRIFVFPNGVTVFVEAKRRGEVPTANQWREIKKLREQGAYVFVIDTVEGGKQMMEYHIREFHPTRFYGMSLDRWYSDPEKLRASAAEYNFIY